MNTLYFDCFAGASGNMILGGLISLGIDKDELIEQIKLLTDLQWYQIIVNANKAGARTCEYMGAMEAFKYLNSSIFN